MSKLTIIRQTLETNPDVTVVKVDENNYLSDDLQKRVYSFWNQPVIFVHEVDFWVAPKGDLYTADGLQAFMMGLVPNLEPTMRDDFGEYRDKEDFGEYRYELVFGRLYFDEKIGEVTKSVKSVLTLTDEELLDVAGFVDGKRTIDTDMTKELRMCLAPQELQRRTCVIPFPNEAIARDISDGKLQFIFGNHISINDLDRYKQNTSL